MVTWCRVADGGSTRAKTGKDNIIQFGSLGFMFSCFREPCNNYYTKLLFSQTIKRHLSLASDPARYLPCP